jgi:hypothetical protein
LYESEIWSLALDTNVWGEGAEEETGINAAKVIEAWRKLHIKEAHDLCY